MRFWPLVAEDSLTLYQIQIQFGAAWGLCHYTVLTLCRYTAKIEYLGD